MILTPIRRYGAMILMLLTIAFSGEVLAKTHTATTSHKPQVIKASNTQVSSKQELCLILPVKMLPLRRTVTG